MYTDRSAFRRWLRVCRRTGLLLLALTLVACGGASTDDAHTESPTAAPPPSNDAGAGAQTEGGIATIDFEDGTLESDDFDVVTPDGDDDKPDDDKPDDGS